MGIFDGVSANNPDQPINLVGRYQRSMQQAAYSPSVAQAAARSRINPTLATRVAAREVAGQMNGALPGLIQQEAQMMEARRIENLNKEREAIALGLNIGGQVLGTAMSAYGGGGGAPSGGGASSSNIGGTVGGGLGQLVLSGNVKARPTPITPAQYASPVQLQTQSQAPMAGAVSAAQPQYVMDPQVDQAINAPMRDGTPLPASNQIAAELYDQAIAPAPRSQVGARRGRRPR